MEGGPEKIAVSDEMKRTPAYSEVSFVLVMC